ncbi:MAG: hypothetical protein IPH53_22505 [Flavobacteriales bacterium]|nr:hypothetical protein [Flavobacteriales bacterium]
MPGPNARERPSARDAGEQLRPHGVVQHVPDIVRRAQRERISKGVRPKHHIALGEFGHPVHTSTVKGTVMESAQV